MERENQIGTNDRGPVTTAPDRIYALPRDSIGDFVFDEQVVAVFPDMIARSVPGYASIIAMTVELAEHYARPGTCVYDLGCSLGAATLPMRTRVPQDCVIHAVDSAPAMVEGLKRRLARDSEGCPVEPRVEDVRNVPFEAASFMVMNFTMQFLPPGDRTLLASRVYQSLIEGGAFVLSEKICFEDPQEQVLMTTLHHAFKRANGYSDLEIAQKRMALENTLLPETLESHTARLRQVGFRSVSAWFRCLNFVSVIALK